MEKLSALDIIKSSGDFVQTGTQNGVPVFELKAFVKPKKETCFRCGNISEECICSEFEPDAIL